MNKTDLINVAIDCYKGRVKKYSTEEASDLVRQALVKANGGSSVLDMKQMRRNGAEIFEIVETLIDAIQAENIHNNALFNLLVEERNTAHGDSDKFSTPDDTDLIVANTSDGNMGVRRQKIGENPSITLRPEMHTIKVYDDLARMMAGEIDINTLIDKVSQAIENKKLDEVYAVFSGLDDNAVNVIKQAGSYDEDTFDSFVSKIGAYNKGNKCMIVTSRAGARAINGSDASEIHKETIYKNGYATLWNGIDVLAVPQKFKVGTTDFALDDDKIYVLPVSSDKPIKQVTAGSTYMTIGDGSENADQSVEINTQLAWVTGFIAAGKIGVFELS